MGSKGGSPSDRGAQRRHSLSLDALSVLFVFMMLFFRARDVFDHPQFWAEDGSVFFQNAWTDGLVSIAYAYAGYLHIVPRVVALAVEPFGAVAAPGLYVTAAVLLMLWSSWTIARTTLPYARLLSVMLVLVPGCGDVLGTLTNAQWILQPALLALVISNGPKSAHVRANQCVFAAVAGLSGPFSILLMPLVLWKVVQSSKARHDARVCTIVILSALVQLTNVATHSSNVEPGTFRPWHVFHYILHLSVYPSTMGWLSYFMIGISVLVAIAYQPEVIIKSLIYTLTSLLSTFIRYIDNGNYMDYGWGERYFYMPRLFLMWCIVIAILDPWRGKWATVAPTWGRLTASAAASAALVLILTRGAEWRRPPLNVLPWRSLAWKIDQGEAAVIVINPSEDTTPVDRAWHVDIPAMP